METADGGKQNDGPDMVWIRDHLAGFLAVTDTNLSVSIEELTNPDERRDRIVKRLVPVEAILESFYPQWRNEVPKGDRRSEEFKQHRDAVVRLLVKLDQQEEIDRKLRNTSSSPSISVGGMHPVVWEAAKTQWNLGSHAEAVDAVGRAVNSMLKQRLGRQDVSEKKLVQEAFSDKPPEPGKPRLRFTHIDDVETAESFRQGVMSFGAGCFAAIRNPLAHLPDEEIDLDEPEALEQLAAWSLVARWIDRAEPVEYDDDAGDKDAK